MVDASATPLTPDLADAAGQVSGEDLDDTADDRRDCRIAARLTYGERQYVRDQAEAAGLSISDYVRARVLGHRVSSQFDRDLVVELGRAKAALARPGGLLKWWLAGRDSITGEEVARGAAADDQALEIREILVDLSARAAEVSEAVRLVVDAMKGHGAR